MSDPTAPVAPRSAIAPDDIDLRDDRLDEATLSELVGRLTHDAVDLMSTQAQLAVAEIKEEARQAGRAAGMMGGSGALAYLTLTLLAFAAAFGIDQAVEELWASFLIVAVVIGAVAAVLYLAGRNLLRNTDPVPRETIQTLQEDKQWLRQQVS